MAEDRVTLNLRVLSPSSEVDGGIHLQDLPTSTTVRELRLKIQDAVASKPGPERMNDAPLILTVRLSDVSPEGRATRVTQAQAATGESQ